MDNFPPDRQIKSIPYPRVSLLTEDKLFDPSSGLPSISCLTKHLQEEGRLDEKCALRLVELARQILEREPNTLAIQRPLTIVGDIHGQFYDLLTVLAAGGDPAKTRYLFLGDYVDRGQFECECIFLLFALKINYPQNVNLLRGNHETRQMTKAFQFKLECKTKYGSLAFYDACMHAFDALPLCALVDSRFLCMHGGLSPDIRTLSDIASLDRFKETSYSGPLCDLLWCDPSEDFDDINDEQPDFKPNNVRGCAHFFSYYACRDFLLRNNLLCIIRGHEVQKNGVRFFRKSSRTKFPVLISLFSAPNYCDTYNNVAAILKIDSNQQISVVHIEAHSHPFVLPNFENGFQFGERFILYYATHLLLSIFNIYSPEELASEDGRQDKTAIELLNKKRLIETMDHAYSDLKKINNIALNLRGLTPSYNSYKELLARPDVQALINEAEKGLISNFDQAIQLDQIFERRPTN
ncbi:unnamed protein product [Rotaria magnacalcarata]|uniref:Serine/threonine-protein phosphatase n=1 Tax=Rotaria magnacalcarata TaxID=392030 RepID=A0A819SS78_9BILA|nr:unnamed protein product [Rotaria magnacalcarata]CAF1673662.1 unnamed protein product [Rotaria magnacalcarata]CAF1931826.1 unnamed protein product [Rotaria magnacalcarata]CAF2035443.1 unnamed protein product [Rotaria magnacalcarata]CAF2149941.1 unnamed protein product [Rotaria magnacalcarata]